MKNWTTFLLLTFSLTIYGQSTFDESKISKETNEIVKDIEEINMVMGSAVGYAGVRPDQFDNFMKLKTIASTSELMQLTNHPTPSVRCYSFWALSHDFTANLFPIVLSHIDDFEFVQTQFGCIISGEAVGDFFINIVTPKYTDIHSKKLDSIQFATLDSILIYTPNKLNAKSKAISRAKPTKSLYPRIRELVITDKDQAALVTLAKYKKEQDVEIILKNRTKSKFDEGGYFYTYKAISQFPHSDFMPLLEKNLKKTLDNTHVSNEWKELYKAITSYQNDDAKRLLLIPFTQVKHTDMKKYHMEFIFNAIQEFNDPIYEDLLWKLWIEEGQINSATFDYLVEKNHKKAFELTKVHLKNINQFGWDSNNLIVEMLELTLSQEFEFGLDVIRTNIKEANVHIFPVFSDKAAEIKDQSFIEPLFERLETERNPHIYLKAAEALIAYNDANINMRILAASKKNKNLKKDWGGNAFNKLLKEHNIKK